MDAPGSRSRPPAPAAAGASADRAASAGVIGIGGARDRSDEPRPCVGLCNGLPQGSDLRRRRFARRRGHVRLAVERRRLRASPSPRTARCSRTTGCGRACASPVRPASSRSPSTPTWRRTISSPTRTSESWALPKDVWTKLAHHVVEQDITVTVQTPAGGATSVKFQVAPVGAGGSMVFWAANPAAAGKTGVESMSPAAIVDDSMLMGFTVGDESTVPTLKITDVKQQVALQNGTDAELALHRLPHRHARRRLRRVRRRLAVGRGVRGRQTRHHGRRAARVRGRAVQGLEQLHDAQDVRAVSVERADDVLARALDRQRTRSRSSRRRSRTSRCRGASRLAELAAGTPRVGRSRLDSDDDDQRADDPDAAATAFGYPVDERRSASGGGVPDLEPRRQVDRLRVGGVPESGPA